MDQIWIEIEENENCGYFPMMVFQATGQERAASSVFVDLNGEHEVIGWEDGAPTAVRVVRVGDSGAGTSTLIYGGNNGIRLRPAGATSPWRLDAEDQFGEPFLSINADARLRYEADSTV